MRTGRGLGDARTRRGNGVRAARVPWVATPEPAHREPAPPKRTVPLQRLDGVGRARRIKPAARSEQRGNQELVDPDRQHENAGDHLPVTRPSAIGPRDGGWLRTCPRARSSACARPVDDAAAASGKARTTTRLPPGRRSSRAAMRWRSRRRTRLRTTAGPTVRETTKPTRAVVNGAGGPAGAGSRCTASRADRPRRPRRTVAVNSARWRSRAVAGSTTLRPRAGCGP